MVAAAVAGLTLRLAFLRALRNLDALADPAKFGPWLAGSLLRVARDLANDLLVRTT